MQDDALQAAEAWLAQGHGVALASVLSTWGSAPRQTGSMLAIRDDGAFAGSVSNGCVEGAVIETGLAVIADGKLRSLEFGVDDGTAWSVGLTCGGRISILVERLDHPADIKTLNAARAASEPLVRVVDLESGKTQLIDPYTDVSPLAGAALIAARSNLSQVAEVDGRRCFFAVFNPRVDLVVVGAVHIAQALAKMAEMMGFCVRVLDPRPAFVTAERFPGVALYTDYADAVFSHSPLQRHSAVVVLAHDPKIDDPALIAALRSNAFYIGALGSQKTQAARRQRLTAEGFSQAEIDRIHGPVGLSIGSRSPAEIAVSILAEIVKTLRQA
ncbi:xanthine dehydrogenase accessory factor [Rhizomicrobium palustre]|uniref:Xanthine dehydrogenase accessory factor n=1 Tax=Rhizomicrobium palustre TaxID=189966 RepID=A0A846N3W9_9PROT|nr:XdhC/CoxI family protein [Rhizomicrobium palustre]NIK89931.1 xanthine dehydrogenase accessory factor [Rhizomicrobium palustre]